MNYIILTTPYLIIPFVIGLMLSGFEFISRKTGMIAFLVSLVIYAYVLTYSLILGSSLSEETIFALLYLIVHLSFYYIAKKREEKQK